MAVEKNFLHHVYKRKERKALLHKRRERIWREKREKMENGDER